MLRDIANCLMFNNYRICNHKLFWFANDFTIGLLHYSSGCLQ